MNINSIKTLNISGKAVVQLKINGKTVWSKEHKEPFVDYGQLCFTAESENSTVKLQNVEGEYKISIDRNLWSDYKLGNVVNLPNIGSKVYFSAKTENATCWNGDNGAKFVMTGKIAASGNIQSLLDKECKRMDVPELCYSYLFFDCKSLTQAPELPATELSYACYASMFILCSSLASTCKLPAKVLNEYCYDHMFCECTSLTEAKTISAEQLAIRCFSFMFKECSALVNAPTILANTSEFQRENLCCANMLAYCSSLTNAQFPNLDSDTCESIVIRENAAFEWSTKKISIVCQDKTIYIN